MEQRNIPLYLTNLLTLCAAQTYHCFDRKKTQRECQRILKKKGSVLLIWNRRQSGTSEFTAGYKNLVDTYASDIAVSHYALKDEEISAFFPATGPIIRELENWQILDFEQLKGRLLSSSYMPLDGDPGFRPMIEALGSLFDKYNQDGTVRLDYKTRMFFGRFQ